MSNDPQQTSLPAFDPTARHQQHPKLRPVRLFPAMVQDQQVVGVSDARQISDRAVFVPPVAQLLLPMLDGKKGLDEIVAAVGRGLTRPILESLVVQLDQAGLLEGPNFDAMKAKMRADFDSADTLPPASTAQFADMLADQAAAGLAGTDQMGPEAAPEVRAELGPKRLREVFDAWMDAALKNSQAPMFEGLPKAVVAPHLDYARGWLNYANTWARLAKAGRPDRVVILGTNHFGEGTGVVGCDKGYATPLGVSPVAQDLIAVVRRRLGPQAAEALFANRYDHEREHSIELQMPWVHHVFGPGPNGAMVPVFGALIHDPTVNAGESYDGKGLALDPFVEALRGAIAELGGTTLVISSADLSHMGPAFGDQDPVAGDSPQAQQMREKALNQDREMLQLLMEGKPDELMASMSWQQNPTRWCSIGNLVAAMKLTGATSMDLLSYSATVDAQGHALVSSASLAMK